MASQAIATTGQARQVPEVVKFREQLEQRAAEIKMALPAHISAEKFQRTVITAVQSDPDLLTADRQSLILACMKAAQDGLLPDKREAAIVIFKENKKQPDGSWQQRKLAQYMPMVYGLRKKILQSGEVAALEVGIVYRAEVENGRFLYEVGMEPPLRHRPSLDLTEAETGDDQIVAAYSIATMKDGTKSFEVMRRFEIDKVRECSHTGATRDRKGQPRKPSGPWVDWFPEQAKKTVMRRHSKTLPMSGDVILDVEGRELEAGASAAALLGSTAGGQPEVIEDRREEETIAHDAETGEIHDEPEQEERPDEQPAEVNDRDETPTDTFGLPPLDAAADEPHPAQAKADAIIAEINAASAIIDVNSIVSRHQPDIDAMPDDMAVKVEVAADQRKNAIKDQHSKAKAKEAAE